MPRSNAIPASPKPAFEGLLYSTPSSLRPLSPIFSGRGLGLGEGRRVDQEHCHAVTAIATLDSYQHFEYFRSMEVSIPSSSSIDNIAAAFAALGQSSRLRIVRVLLSAYPQGLPAGEIQKELGISAPTLSHHLDKLRQVGIITAARDRQWIWYRVRSEALKALIDFLFEECCTRNPVVAVPDLEPAAAGTAAQNQCCGEG